MQYLEWNNIISEHFFNPGNAGKEVYLYITRQEVINVSRNYFNKESDDEIWKDKPTPFYALRAGALASGGVCRCPMAGTWLDQDPACSGFFRETDASNGAIYRFASQGGYGFSEAHRGKNQFVLAGFCLFHRRFD